MLDWMIRPQWLAQGDGEEWMNILFIVAVAVFWAIAGLIKTVSAKKSAQQSQGQGRPRPADGQKRETWQRRLARKAEEIQRAAEERLQSIQERAGARAQPEQTPQHGKADGGRVTVQARRGGEPVLVYERPDRRETPQQRQKRVARLYQEQQAEARRRQKQQLEIAERDVHAQAPPSQPKPVSVSDVSVAAVETPQPAYPASSLIDYSDAEALKRAILQYEILGKPLSLRDPFERMSGF